MKPERLFQMMDEISPDYIAEGKPAFTRTRPAKQHTPRRNPAQEEVFLSVQKPVQKRRKENTLKGSVIQRLTTGLVAAAALTVFVGTGVFIAKQEKDKQALSSAVPAAEIAEQTTKNFLGGTGELRALQPILGLNINRIIYDDDFLYFNDSVNSPAGIYRVPRNSPQQTEDTFQEIGFNDDLWATDNGQFFVCDGGKLYAIAQDGTKTLFFDAAQINLQADFEIKDYVYLNIKHICDDAYVFYFHALNNIAEEGANKLQKCACLYHAESNKIEILENSLLNDMNWEYLLPDGKNGFYVCAAAPQNGSPQLYHYTVGETVTKTGLFDEDTVIVPSSMYLSPDGGTLYFCSEYNSTLRKFDLNAGGESTVVLNEVPSQDYQYVVNDGTVSYFHSGCKEICCSDLEWTTHEVLWSADDSNLPAELANAYHSEKTLHWLPLGVDDNYLYVSFSSDAPETVGILDRKTGEMRYLKYDLENEKLTEEETKQQTEESSVQEAEVQTADSNIFGGKGELRALQPTGGMSRGNILYDDDYIYVSDLFNRKTGVHRMPRQAAQQTTDTLQETGFNENLWVTENGQFFVCESGKFYMIAQDGTKTLFFDAAQSNLQADFEIKGCVCLNIKYICSDTYVFCFDVLNHYEKESATDLNMKTFACLYHADTKETELLDSAGEMMWSFLRPDGKNGFYVFEALQQQIYHYTVGETVTKTGLLFEDKSIRGNSIYLSPDGGTLYFCSDYDPPHRSLRKLDLNSDRENSVALADLPSNDYQYVVNNDKVYFFNSSRKEFWCSDLEWTTHEVLWSADDPNLPAELANVCQSGKTPLWMPLEADDNYLYVSFDLDVDGMIGILDRKTGEMRYLKYDLENEKLTEEETKQQTEESSVQEAKVQTADSNIFGGKGELRVVAPYLRSGAVLRDDTCYYSGLTAFNEEGGTSEFSPTYHGHTVITDGEKLYTTFGEYIFAIDENGSETLFYTMKDICKYHGETCEIIALDKSPYVVTITTLMHVYNDVYMIAGSAFDSKTEESLPFGYFFCHDKISDASHSEYGGYFCLPEYLVNSDALMGDMIVAPEKMGFYCCYDEHIVFVNCYDGKPIEGYDYRTHRIVSPYQDNVVPGSWTIKDNILYYLNKKGEFCKHVISDDAVVYLNDITGTPKPTKEQYAKNTEKTVLSAPEGRLDALIFDGNTVYAITDFNCIWYTQINDTKSWKKLMDRRFQTDAIDSLSDCSFAVDGRLFVMNCESRERNCTRILEAKFYIYLLGEGTEQQTEESFVQEAASSLAAQK